MKTIMVVKKKKRHIIKSFIFLDYLKISEETETYLEDAFQSMNQQEMEEGEFQEKQRVL